jgi:hypothetical protein
MWDVDRKLLLRDTYKSSVEGIFAGNTLIAIEPVMDLQRFGDGSL